MELSLIEALERIAQAIEASNDLEAEKIYLLRQLLEKSGSSEDEGTNHSLVGKSASDGDIDPEKKILLNLFL